MKILVTAVILLFTIIIPSQTKKIDKLNLLFKQGNYRIVERKCKRAIKKNNLMINYLARDEDKYCWQFSNKGYFNFKSNIPKILSQFKLN